MGQSAIDVARGTIEAFNAGDWERLRELHTPECVEEELSTGRRLDGFDAMLEAARGWKDAFADGRGTVERAYADGDAAILEITWEGTHSGALRTPTGEELPPTNRQARVRACQVFEVEDGKVKATRHYFDLMTILQQLGVGASAQVGAA
jgi:steroid delta-isomerase-like uncharacterized protein